MLKKIKQLINQYFERIIKKRKTKLKKCVQQN